MEEYYGWRLAGPAARVASKCRTGSTVMSLVDDMKPTCTACARGLLGGQTRVAFQWFEKGPLGILMTNRFSSSHLLSDSYNSRECSQEVSLLTSPWMMVLDNES